MRLKDIQKSAMLLLCDYLLLEAKAARTAKGFVDNSSPALSKIHTIQPDSFSVTEAETT